MKKPMTSQQSEALDLAEKGMKSPLNPKKNGKKAEAKDEDTVLRTALPERKK